MARVSMPFLLVLVAAAAAAADGPFAVIDTTDWDKVAAYTAPVTIASIDGRDYLSETRRTIAPGKHTLVFVTTRLVKSSSFRQTRRIELEVKPCTVYYFYAKHASAFSPEWRLELLRETAIANCGEQAASRSPDR